jgi:hypothetical protein
VEQVWAGVGMYFNHRNAILAHPAQWAGEFIIDGQSLISSLFRRHRQFKSNQQ